MSVRLFVAIAITLLSVAVFGQDTRREESIPGSLLRSIFLEADESGPPAFPDLRTAERGTLISFHSSFHDSDVILTTGKKEYPQAKLIELAHKIVAELGRPKTDYVVATGARLQFVDLEFNDYLHLDQWSSSTDVQIGKIIRLVEASDVPRPIGFAIKVEGHPSIAFQGKKVDKTSVYATKTVADTDVISVRIERHWYGLVAMVLMGCLFVFACLVLPVVLVRGALKEKKPEGLEPAEAPKTLVEAQDKYSEKTPLKHRIVIAFFPAVIILFSFFGQPAVRDSEYWIPSSFNPSSFFVMLIPILAVFPITAIIRKKRGIPIDEKVARAFRPMFYFFVPMLVAMLFFMVVISKPQWFRGAPRWAIVSVPLLALPTGLIAMFVASAREKRRNNAILGPGDPDYDMAMELAKLAKVKVNRVEIKLDLPGANAAASIFGRVYVTQDLREKMSLAERRAILAHEIGHIKGQHVPIFMLISFVFIGVLIFALNRLSDMSDKWPEWAKGILASPFLFWVPQLFLSLVVMPPIRKRAEYYADRFALEQTKDYSLVASALAKIHLINHSPHTFRPGHERIASHPSLTKRLDSLRKVAAELGLPIDETEVDKLFYGSPTSDEITPSATAE